jgi:hypothetical protein
VNATRDSLFGNTEVFNNLSNIFPQFKLTNLDSTKAYNFTFYASRTGVGDVRETGDTVTGGTSGISAGGLFMIRSPRASGKRAWF